MKFVLTFFAHVLVKLSGRFGHNVDCCYTDSELSVVSWKVSELCNL